MQTPPYQRFSQLVNGFFEANSDSISECGLSLAEIFVPAQSLSLAGIQSTERIEHYVTKIRSNYSAAVLPIPRRVSRPEFDYKSEYASTELLGSFNFFHEIVADEFSNPIVFVSDTYCLENGRVTKSQNVRSLTKAQLERSKTSTRTWIGSDGLLHKTELACLDFFDRSQVANEATFLQSIQFAHPLTHAFPKINYFSAGHVVVELAREVLPGEQISDKDKGDLSLITSFHSVCVLYSRHGLFHNDLRPWNLLVDEHSVRLIDFGNVSTRDQDVSGLPQVVAYIGTILCLIGKLQVSPTQFEFVVREIVDVKMSHEQWSELWLNLPRTLSLSRLTMIKSPIEIARRLISDFKINFN
jgi:serine/threonine protein kinase